MYEKMDNTWKRNLIGIRKMIKKAIFKNCKKGFAGWTLLLILFLLFPMPGVFAMEDGEYCVTVDMTGGSGKASITSPTLMTVEDGTPMARIQWSSANYDYMIVDGVYYENQSEEGMNSVFEIPILCWDEEMEVIADTTAMGHPVEIRYQLIFYLDSVGNKSEMPQEAAKRVLCAAFVIIIVGGILNYFVKKKIYS